MVNLEAMFSEIKPILETILGFQNWIDREKYFSRLTIDELRMSQKGKAKLGKTGLEILELMAHQKRR